MGQKYMSDVKVMIDNGWMEEIPLKSSSFQVHTVVI
jgi:hypothetical protein